MPGLVFRQLFDAASSTYTYLLADADAHQAILIDPVFEQAARDEALIRELGLKLVATLDTHVHADHVTAAWLHRRASGSEIVVAAAAGAQGMQRALAPDDRVGFGSRFVEARATPGHTAGCMSLVLDDRSIAFTGDALLIRGCGRTDFQQGSAQALFDSVHRELFTLPPGCLLYPAHDYRGNTVTSVAEERAHNPRLGGSASVADFAGYMAALGLPHPKAMERAVPANLRCGEPDAGTLLPNQKPLWAPLAFSYAGVWQIEPEVLAERLAGVTLVDVREPAEWDGALPSPVGALRIPLAELAARSGEIAGTRPIVTVCRSGTRSAQAALLLGRAGFSHIANLAGGLLRWHDHDS
jgi:sulfur dioxygenase